MLGLRETKINQVRELKGSWAGRREAARTGRKTVGRERKEWVQSGR